MAKKSKIAKNEQRRKLVVRYAERRAELKEIIRRLSRRVSSGQRRWPPCNGCRATPVRYGCATATRSTAGAAVICESSACPG